MLFWILIMIFAAAALATFAFTLVLRGKMGTHSRNVKRRLDDMTARYGEDTVTPSIIRDDKLSQIPLVNRILQKFNFSKAIKRTIDQAGMNMNTGTVVLGTLSLAALLFLILLQITNSILLGFVAAIVGGVQPYFYLQYRKRKRRDQFESLLPEALDMVTNALKSGFSFETALKMVAQEIPDPLGFEFAMTFEEQNLGVSLGEALGNLRERMPSDDLDLFITALMIHKKTGGNLAEILEKTANTIRERFKLKREIRTKTAHGRFSGLVLVLMPLGMIAAILIMSPDYFMILIHEKIGNYFLGAAVIMQLLGIWVIRRIVDIKI